MFSSVRRRTLTGVAIGCVLGVSAMPASAATQQNGLVNVSLTDTTIQVPVAVAANVCDVTANVIATNSFTTNGSPCTAVSMPSATGGGGGGGGNTSQQGLVNVSLTGTMIQVPVGIAANICDVTANVITSGTFTTNEGPCTAVTSPTATG